MKTLLFFLGACVASSWSLELFPGPHRRFGFGHGSYAPFRPFRSHPFPQFGPSFGRLRDFSPFPMRSPQRFPFGGSRRSFWPPRSISPPIGGRGHFYGQRPSFARSHPRISPFGVRHIPDASSILPYQSGSRIMSHRTVSPFIGRPRFAGSRRIVHRVPGLTGSRGVISGRQIRLRRPVRFPAISGSGGHSQQVLALYAVDDARHNGHGSLHRISRPLLSETVDKGVKVSAVPTKKVLKAKSIAKSGGTKGSSIKIVEEKRTTEILKKSDKSIFPIVEKAAPIADKSETVVDATPVKTELTVNIENNANANTDNTAATDADLTMVVNNVDVNTAAGNVADVVANDATVSEAQAMDVVINDVTDIASVQETNVDVIVADSVPSSVEQQIVVVQQETPVLVSAVEHSAEAPVVVSAVENVAESPVVSEVQEAVVMPVVVETEQQVVDTPIVVADSMIEQVAEASV